MLPSATASGVKSSSCVHGSDSCTRARRQRPVSRHACARGALRRELSQPDVHTHTHTRTRVCTGGARGEAAGVPGTGKGTHRGVKAHVHGVDEDFHFLRRLVRVERLERDRVQAHWLLELEVDQKLLVAVARQKHGIVVARTLLEAVLHPVVGVLVEALDARLLDERPEVLDLAALGHLVRAAGRAGAGAGAGAGGVSAPPAGAGLGRDSRRVRARGPRGPGGYLEVRRRRQSLP